MADEILIMIIRHHILNPGPTALRLGY